MHIHSRRSVHFLVLAVVLVTLFMTPQRVQGATIVVTTFTDQYKTGAECSLREAIEAANTNVVVSGCAAGSAVAADTIYLPSIIGGERKKYALTRTGTEPTDAAAANSLGDLDILGPLTVLGDGSKEEGDTFSTRITAFGLGARAIHIHASAGTVTIQSVLIADGSAGGTAGEARGGAIFNQAPTLNLRRVHLYNSYSLNVGGGVSNAFGSTLNVAVSIISKNKAQSSGGGIANAGTLIISDSLFTENEGSRTGGGIDNGGYARLTNVTLGKNISEKINEALGGAGIFNDGELELLNVTIANNNGIGLALSGTSSGFMKNTLIGQNTVPVGQPPNCDIYAGSAFASEGGNMEDKLDCTFFTAGDKNDNNIDGILLDTLLTDNPGFTKTFALLTGSPAIDGGTNTGCLASDQRWAVRPVDGDNIPGAICDVGAYEFYKDPTAITRLVTFLPMVSR